MSNGKLVLLVAKVVDDLRTTGVTSYVDEFLVTFNKKFQFGSVVRGLGILKFYGMKIVQNEDILLSTHVDDNLNSLECYPLSRIWRRQVDLALTVVEKSSFMSVNSSLGWLRITASPLCVFYAIHLQQMMPSVTVNSVMSQIKYLRLLKKCGTLIAYPPCPKSGSLHVSVLVFSDAGRRLDSGQLSFFPGILVANFQKGSLFYKVLWCSQKSKNAPLSQLVRLKYYQRLKQSTKQRCWKWRCLCFCAIVSRYSSHWTPVTYLGHCQLNETQLKSLHVPMLTLFGTSLKLSMSKK